MDRKINFSVGEYYHIYNRGVDKRKIYLTPNDHKRFVTLLFVSNGNRAFDFRSIQAKQFHEIERGEPLVAVGAYCLMPNHFHILVKEIAGGGLSRFMEKLSTGYAKYFNTKHKRSGALFEGRFRAQHVDHDEYLKYLYSYIHLNPLKLFDAEWKQKGKRDLLKTKKFLARYQYSSYPDFTGEERQEGLILSRNEFPDYFEKEGDFQNFINDWLEFSPSYGRLPSVTEGSLPL